MNPVLPAAPEAPAPAANGDAVQAYNALGDRLGLHRRPRLLICQGLKVPMLAGLLRPAVLLPQGSMTGEELGCDEDALRALPPEAYAAYGQTILAAVGKLQNQERRAL